MKETFSKRIFLSPPHYSGEEEQFVEQALKHTKEETSVSETHRFEQDICHFTGALNVIALSSVKAAMYWAYKINDIQPGDIVLCQKFSPPSVPQTLLSMGATPVFINSETGSWNVSTSSLEQSIGKCINGEIKLKGKAKSKSLLPKAIVVDHNYGMPASMEKIKEIAIHHNIALIENALDGFGATWHKQSVGTFGDTGIYGFNENNIITAKGGAALVIKNKDKTAIAKRLLNESNLIDPALSDRKGKDVFFMDVHQAAFGRAQLKQIKKRIRKKRQVFQWYRGLFTWINHKGYHIEWQTEARHAYSNRWITAIFLDPLKNKGISNKNLQEEFKKYNIETSLMPKPLYLHQQYQHLPHLGENLDDRLYQYGLCLPSGTNMQEEDTDRIFHVLNKVFKD